MLNQTMDCKNSLTKGCIDSNCTLMKPKIYIFLANLTSLLTTHLYNFFHLNKHKILLTIHNDNHFLPILIFFPHSNSNFSYVIPFNLFAYYIASFSICSLIISSTHCLLTFPFIFLSQMLK